VPTSQSLSLSLNPLANAKPAGDVPGWEIAAASPVRQKETGTGLGRSRIKYAGGKPATGRLCRTGPGILGRGPGSRPPSHRCDMPINAQRAKPFQRSVAILPDRKSVV